MQGNSNKMHNKLGTGIKSHKTMTSETKQTKTSQAMDVTLILKTKGNRRVQTTTNRVETRKDKVDLTAALHTGATGTKKVSNLSRWTRRTTTTDSRVTISAQ